MVVNDAGEASALSYKCEDINDIYTCSWGPYDDGKRLEGPGHLASVAMDRCIKHGRKGKGAIYVWACGNGATSSDNINYDGYANNRYTIAIGSVTDAWQRAWYSETGSPLMAVAPSSGGKQGITSTTTSAAKTGGTDCTSSFGGTSAASPLAAGLIALILQSNPQLGWRDVQHVIVRSCSHNGLNGFQTNGAGVKHSVEWGFGLLDAKAAVELATGWVNVPENVNKTATHNGKPDKIAVGKTGTVTFEIPTSPKIFHIEHIEVHIIADLTHRGNLVISLTSPSGMSSPLQDNHRSDQNNHIDWSYWTVRHWGENPTGTWSVNFKNEGTSEASISSVKLTMYGYETDN